MLQTTVPFVQNFGCISSSSTSRAAAQIVLSKSHHSDCVTGIHLRMFAVICFVFMCFLPSRNLRAQETSISGVWHFSPIIAVPLEGDSVFYQQDNFGSIILNNGASAVSTQTSSDTNSQTSTGPNVIGGYAATSAFSAAISGGDAGIAFANGFGVGIGADVISQSAHALSGSVSATFSSSISQGADIDAAGSASVAGDFSVTGASSIVRDLAASTSATVKTTGPLGPIRPGFSTSILPSGAVGNFFQSTADGDAFAAPSAGVSAIGFLAGSATGALVDIHSSEIGRAHV